MYRCGTKKRSRQMKFAPGVITPHRSLPAIISNETECSIKYKVYIPHIMLQRNIKHEILVALHTNIINISPSDFNFNLLIAERK